MQGELLGQQPQSLKLHLETQVQVRVACRILRDKWLDIRSRPRHHPSVLARSAGTCKAAVAPKGGIAPG